MSVYMILTMIPLPLKRLVPSRIPRGIPSTVEITTEEKETYRERPTIRNISGSPANISRKASTNPCPIVSISLVYHIKPQSP